MSVPVVVSVKVTPNATGAIAVEGGNKIQCSDDDEKGFCMRGDLCPYDHGADPVVLEDVELSSTLNYNRFLSMQVRKLSPLPNQQVFLKTRLL